MYKRDKILLVIMIILLFITGFLYGDDSLILDEHPELFSYTIRTTHPRFILTPENLDSYRQRMQNDYPGDYQDVIDYAYSNFRSDIDWQALGDTIAPLDGYYNRKRDVVNMIIAFALIYQMGNLGGFDYHGYTAIDYGEQGIKALKILPAEDDPVYVAGHHNHGRLTFGAHGLPFGYDWLYQLLTESEKKEIILRLIHNARTAFHPEEDNEITLDIDNWPLHPEVMNGMAFYGDFSGDSVEYDSIIWEYDEIAKFIIDTLHMGTQIRNSREVHIGMLNGGALDALNIFNRNGITIDGYGYLTYHSRMGIFLEAVYTTIGHDYSTLCEFYNKLPYWLTYAHLPQSMAYVPSNQEKHDPYVTTGSGHAMLFSGLITALSHSYPDQASLSKWVFNNLTPAHIYDQDKALFVCVLNDPNIMEKSPVDLGLPLTNPFSPMYTPIYSDIGGQGVCMVRSSWTDSNATHLTFQGRHWSGGRSGNRKSGAFTIWKNKGWLIPWRGGKYKRGFNHKLGQNTFLLNGNEWQEGENMLEDTRELFDPSCQNLEDGLIYVEEEQGEYHYFKNKGGKTYENSLSSWTREFIYFHGATSSDSDFFVVYDRITDAGNIDDKHFVLHVTYDPELRTSGWTGSTESGTSETAWRIRYENTPYITIINDGGPDNTNNAHVKGFVRTLLPESTIVYKIGGEGYEFVDWDGNEINTSDGSGTLNNEEKFWMGSYRLQIVPKISTDYDKFLHVIEATDTSDYSPAEMKRLSGIDIVGALVGDKITLFSEEGFLDTGSVDISNSGTYNVLLCGLHPDSKYELNLGSNIDSLWSSSKGTIYKQGTFPGEINIKAITIAGVKESYNENSNIFKCSSTLFTEDIKIEYSLTSSRNVSLKVYNIAGSLVKTIFDEIEPSGLRTHYWNGNDKYGNKVSTGVYFLRLESKGVKDRARVVELKKVVLIK